MMMAVKRKTTVKTVMKKNDDEDDEGDDKDDDVNTEEIEEPKEVVNMDLREFDPTSKKKRRGTKRPRLIIEPASDIPLPTTEGLNPNSWIEDDSKIGHEREYHYAELLKRIYDRMKQKGDAPGTIKPISIDPPEIGKVGSRRVAWINFHANCKSIARKPKHVLAFVLTELGTTGAIGGDGKLVIRGRYQPKQLENLLKKYIVEYILCKSCKSVDTVLKKENRITFLVCNTCGSSTSVASIKSGFQAQTSRKARPGVV